MFHDTNMRKKLIQKICPTGHVKKNWTFSNFRGGVSDKVGIFQLFFFLNPSLSNLNCPNATKRRVINLK